MVIVGVVRRILGVERLCLRLGGMGLDREGLAGGEDLEQEGKATEAVEDRVAERGDGVGRDPHIQLHRRAVRELDG